MKSNRIKVLVFLLVLIAMASAALLLFGRFTATNQKTDGMQSNAPQDTYSSWLTYAASTGDFTLKYPADWNIDPTIGDPVYGKGSVVRLTHQSGMGNFGLDIQTSDKSRATNIGKDIHQGTVKKLANGLNVWQQSQSSATSDNCPVLTIVSQDAFGTSLANGKYLSVYGSYCWRQDLTVDNSYEQQVNSADWQAAIHILESVGFK